MPRKKPDIFYIYKTTNLINNKFYIGKHCTTKLENDYLGSGKRLRYSIRKYGKENFKKEILEFCENQEVLAEREKEIVNQEMLNNSLCMNLMIGGRGGYAYNNITKEQHSNFSKLGGINSAKIRKENPEIDKKVKFASSKSLKERHKLKQINYVTWPKGKRHKEETKLKMSQSSKGIGRGNSNSQYGTMWITNGIENKKIKNTDIIPNGYYKGRKKYAN